MKAEGGKKKRIWIKRVLAMMAAIFFYVNGGTIVAKDRADNIIEGQNSGKNNITAPNTGGDISVMGHYETERGEPGYEGGGSGSGGGSSGGSHKSGGGGSSGGGGGSSGGSHKSGGGSSSGSGGNSGGNNSNTGGGSGSGGGGNSGGSHNSGGDTSGGGNSGGESEKDSKEDAEKENDRQREETKDEAERIERDEKEAEEQKEGRDKEGAENNAQQQAQSNSAQAGDPVRITSGTYVLEEGELGVIKRSYTSGKKGSGRIGKWWASSLDERIIRGVSAGAVEFYQRAKANEGAAKGLYERAESREKTYAGKWKETVDEGYLGGVKGKYDSVC